MTRLWLAVLGVSVGAGCLAPVDLSGPGFKCESDSQCKSAAPCFEGHCIGPVDPTQPKPPIRAFFYALGELGPVMGDIATMKGVHASAAVARSSGAGSTADQLLPGALAHADDAGFKWAVELASTSDSELDWVVDTHGSRRGYLQIAARPVVLLRGAFDCDRVAALSSGSYLVVQSFPGHESCRTQPDGWYPGPDAFVLSAAGHDLAAFRAGVAQMIDGGAGLQLIDSFNDVDAGTAVSGDSAFLDALR